jgi:hypothetical protein
MTESGDCGLDLVAPNRPGAGDVAVWALNIAKHECYNLNAGDIYYWRKKI